MRMGRFAVALLVGAAATAYPVRGQGPDTTYTYRHGSEAVRFFLYLDSVGVEPAPGLAADAFAVHLDGVPLPVARWLPEHVAVLALPAPAAERDTIFAWTHRIAQQNDGQVAAVGPLARLATPTSPAIVVTNRFIVRYVPGATAAQTAALESSMDAEPIGQIPFDPRLRLFEVRNESSRDVLTLVDEYAANPLTEWAELDFLGGSAPAGPPEPARAPDPLLAEQWHLDNGGVGDVAAAAAWNVTHGEPSIVVAVIENTGFDVTHPDLANQLWTDPSAPGVHGWNFKTCPSGVVPTPLSLPTCGSAVLTGSWSEHGTQMAGLVAAQNDNGQGGSGVCPGCRLMLLVTGPGQWGKIYAFLFAKEKGADIINASWTMISASPLESFIVDAGQNGRGGLGMPVFMATGNVGIDVCGVGWSTFAMLPEVMAVAGTDETDAVVPLSNFGSCVGVAAPGGRAGKFPGIVTTDALGAPGTNDDHQPSVGDCPLAPLGVDLADRDYTRCSGGTSAATAITSGVAGLMLSVKPGLTASQVRSILRRTAEKVGCPTVAYSLPCGDPMAFNVRVGYGRVNAARALDEVKKVTVDNTPLEPSAPSTRRFELGTRLGYTRVAAGSVVTKTWNTPGSGPMAAPILHLTWLPPGALSIELQSGFTRTAVSSPVGDRTRWVAAIQPAYSFPAGAGQLYVGPNLAHHEMSGTGGAGSSTGIGAAAGYRWLTTPRLALRVEGRYRHWSAGAGDEVGMALGFGVVLP